MINNLYRYHKGSTEVNQGLLQCLVILGNKIEAAGNIHPDADWATFDPVTGAMVLNEKDYRDYGNITTTGDLIEEMINRLGEIGGGGNGNGGSTLPEILRSAVDLSGVVPPGYSLGYNHTNSNFYYKGATNHWKIFDGEILLSALPLSGDVPGKKKIGFDFVELKFYFRNESNQWTPINNDSEIYWNDEDPTVGVPAPYHRIGVNKDTGALFYAGSDAAWHQVPIGSFPLLYLNTNTNSGEVLDENNYPGVIVYRLIDSNSRIIKAIPDGIEGRERTLYNYSEHLQIVQNIDGTYVGPFPNLIKTGTMPVFLLPGDSATFRHDGAAWHLIAMSRGSLTGVFDTWSDFLGGPQPFGVRFGNGGAAQADNFSTVSGAKGIFQINTGTAALGWASLGFTISGFSAGNGPSFMAGRSAVENSLNNHEVYIGFHNGASTAPDNGYWLKIDSSYELKICSGNGTNVAEVGTGITLNLIGNNTDYFEWAIYLNQDHSSSMFYMREKGNMNQWVIIGGTVESLAFETITPQILVRKIAGTAAVKIQSDSLGERSDIIRHA
jgi:hypothetical protein